MTRMLFVGGPLHGQLHDINPAMTAYPVGDDEPPGPRREHIYRPEKIGKVDAPLDADDVPPRTGQRLVLDVMIHDSIERGMPEAAWHILDAAFPRHLARRLDAGGVTPPRESPPEALARVFHETYERLAPAYGWKTQPASARPWDDLPPANRELMVAVCAEVLNHLHAAE